MNRGSPYGEYSYKDYIGDDISGAIESDAHGGRSVSGVNVYSRGSAT